MPTPRSPRARSRARWYAAGSIVAAVTVGGVVASPSTAATPPAAPTAWSPKPEVARTTRTTKRRPSPAPKTERRSTPERAPRRQQAPAPEPADTPQPTVAPETTVAPEPSVVPAATPRTEPQVTPERHVLRRKPTPAPRLITPAERARRLPRTPEARVVQLPEPRETRRAEKQAEHRQAVVVWKRNLDRPVSAKFGQAVTGWSGIAGVRSSASAPACVNEAAATVAHQVAEIFRCRLEAAGYPEHRIRRIVAEAVTVAQCESGFLPHVVVFGGRYVNARHPSTGYFYTAAGVFQFIRDTADQWIDGGYGNALDAAKNIDAAARLYLANEAAGYPGWADWACAAANDGFRSTSVLPGYPGGPSRLPNWAWTF